MTDETSGDPKSDALIASSAETWLARRDRGLDAREQDAFLQWLAEDPRHRVAFRKIEAVWTALDRVAEWQPPQSGLPNPDLLSPSRTNPARRRARWALLGGLAAALVLLPLYLTRQGPSPAETVQGVRVIPRPERQLLPDGSIAEVNHGGSFKLAYTPTERRVLLVKGELHVTVAHNPTHPFIVEVEGVTVRALGTAFNVRNTRNSVEVLVTEGVVQIARPSSAGPAAPVTPVAAHEKARVDLGSTSAVPVVSRPSPEEIERELAWQSVRLEFDGLPLSAVIAEFNLRNVQQVRIGDPATGRMPVGGVFRADQVASFVRLLETSYNVAVEVDADGVWVLRNAGDPRPGAAPSPAR